MRNHRPVPCADTTAWARGVVGALLGVLLAGVVLAVDLPVIHGHDQDGLYNQDCPLARLAAGVSRGPSADAMAAPRPLPVCEVVSLPPRAAPAPPLVAASASRAPPPVV
jgi:hypothetical protein